MKRILFVLGFVATMFTLQAQQAEVRNFAGWVTWDKAINIVWYSEGDAMFTEQVLLTSTDGVMFTELSRIPVMNGGAGQIYQYKHTTPVLGVNYYQLVLVFSDGSSRIHDTIKVEYGTPPIYSYPTTPRPGAPSGATPRG
jgi:hypothetical protein